jgi:hypothetical protein
MVLYLVTMVLIADLLLAKERPDQMPSDEFLQFVKFLKIEFLVFLSNLSGMMVYTFLAYYKTTHVTIMGGQDQSDFLQSILRSQLVLYYWQNVVLLATIVVAAFIQTLKSEPEVHKILLWWLVLAVLNVTVFAWWTFTAEPDELD